MGSTVISTTQKDSEYGRSSSIMCTKSPEGMCEGNRRIISVINVWKRGKSFD